MEHRLEYVPRIEVEPLLAGAGVTGESIRKGLEANQSTINNAIAASGDLHGALPPAVTLTEREIELNLHLTRPRTVLVLHTRLLRADAVRNWELEAPTESATRLAAALRIADFLLTQDDELSRFRGGQALIPIFFDMDALCEEGFAESLSPSTRSALAMQVRSVDPRRFAHWDGMSKAAQVRRSLLERLTQ